MGCAISKTNSSPDKNLNIGKNKLASEVSECKFVFLGDSAVGKSSIFQRFCKNNFTGEHEVTIGVAYMQQKIQLKNGNYLKMHLWDTGGEERFRGMAPLYYRDTNVAVLVYDVTNRSTFDSIKYWMNELDSKIKQDGIIIAMVGNKCDLPDGDKQVNTITGKKFAEDNKIFFAETSAKTGEGVNNLFELLSEEIAKKMSASKGIKR